MCSGRLLILTSTSNPQVRTVARQSVFLKSLLEACAPVERNDTARFSFRGICERSKGTRRNAPLRLRSREEQGLLRRVRFSTVRNWQGYTKHSADRYVDDRRTNEPTWVV